MYIFVCFCMFMTYSTSCCLVTKLWIHGIYVCIYSTYVRMYVLLLLQLLHFVAVKTYYFRSNSASLCV
jgi:hypothetical protein